MTVFFCHISYSSDGIFKTVPKMSEFQYSDLKKNYDIIYLHGGNGNDKPISQKGFYILQSREIWPLKSLDAGTGYSFFWKIKSLLAR